MIPHSIDNHGYAFKREGLDLNVMILARASDLYESLSCLENVSFFDVFIVVRSGRYLHIIQFLIQIFLNNRLISTFF